MRLAMSRRRRFANWATEIDGSELSWPPSPSWYLKLRPLSEPSNYRLLLSNQQGLSAAADQNYHFCCCRRYWRPHSGEPLAQIGPNPVCGWPVCRPAQSAGILRPAPGTKQGSCVCVCMCVLYVVYCVHIHWEWIGCVSLLRL